MGKASTYLRFDPAGATWVFPLLVVAFIIMGSDWVAIDLGRLRILGIPFPPFLSYAYIVLPAAVGVLWLGTRRRHPVAFGLLALALTLASSIGTAKYADSLLSRVPIRHDLQTEERDALKSRVPFPFCEIGDQDGWYVLFERADGRQAQMVSELDKLHLLR